jgi:hypothetical protein
LEVGLPAPSTEMTTGVACAGSAATKIAALNLNKSIVRAMRNGAPDPFILTSIPLD